ncbi:four helix bundle protein [Anatilimnocola floriformis]|uniref:four helix bundle protein n=1 Tax=Anatilimnocola floriformis TaxID=2948575 RepID=UPI0020C4B14C|nr:four helix bundle protein [Anatilimnocola floriformis]
MPFAFEKLLVYQHAVDFVDDVCERTAQFTRGYGFISSQLNRAALSISTNIAEGNGRFTVPDRKHFFGIARGSVHECVPLLELAGRRKLLPMDEQQSLKARLEEISKMLNGLIKSLDDYGVAKNKESRQE